MRFILIIRDIGIRVNTAGRTFDASGGERADDRRHTPERASVKQKDVI
jgi:hypothetical protein